jgi:hypothetical protein
MTDLPPAIKAAQEKLRPRFEAKTKEFEALAAERFADSLVHAEVTHDVSAEEALAVLDGHAPLNS